MWNFWLISLFLAVIIIEIREKGKGKSDMLKIGIVEDDDKFIAIISDYLTRFGREQGISIQTEIFHNGEQLVFDYQPVYDILLMDIEMPEMDGMTAAAAVRREDTNVLIIFITNMAQYAIKGYKVKAHSYILKPLNYSSFAFEMEDALETLSRRTEDSVLLNTGDGLKKIQIADIQYVESCGHTMRVHAKDGIFDIRESMKNMEEKLKPFFFERSHVSYLVNLAHVSSLDGEVAAVGSDTVLISRHKRKSFMLALTSYLGGGTHG